MGGELGDVLIGPIIELLVDVCVHFGMKCQFCLLLSTLLMASLA